MLFLSQNQLMCGVDLLKYLNRVVVVSVYMRCLLLSFIFVWCRAFILKLIINNCYAYSQGRLDTAMMFKERPENSDIGLNPERAKSLYSRF